MDIIAGRFGIERWLGEGSLGHLYQVEQFGTAVRNILRVLPHGAAGSQVPDVPVTGNATRILHPNIVPVQEVGRTPDGRMYVVMENASGTLLAEVAARGAVPLRWAVEIARQMIAGVRAAHEGGTIHGTLTPESVLIGSTPNDDTLTARILDLGLSTLFREQGCPPDARYAGPEVLAGAAPDELSDVFSLGAITYQLVTGTPAGTPPEQPNQIPTALVPVLETALAGKPEDRFRTVAQLSEALERALAEPPAPSAAAEPPPTVIAVPNAEAPAEPPPPAWARRRLGFAGLAVAAIALLLWLYLPANMAPDEAATSRPLPIALEEQASGTQRAPVPSAPVAETRPSEKPAAVAKAAKRRVTTPILLPGQLLPGQGYQAGLARDETAPTETPAPADAETSTDAEARAAAQTAVTSYASAIEASDVDAIRRVYPGLTEQERSDWQEFFAAARDLKATLTIKDVDVKGRVAQAEVTGVYEYANPSLNRIERRPVAFRATLTRGPDGWQLSEVR